MTHTYLHTHTHTHSHIEHCDIQATTSKKEREEVNWLPKTKEEKKNFRVHHPTQFAVDARAQFINFQIPIRSTIKPINEINVRQYWQHFHCDEFEGLDADERAFSHSNRCSVHWPQHLTHSFFFSLFLFRWTKMYGENRMPSNRFKRRYQWLTE